MPSIAVAFFGGDAGTVGLLLSASGAGALWRPVPVDAEGHAVQFRLVQVAPFIAGWR